MATQGKAPDGKTDGILRKIHDSLKCIICQDLLGQPVKVHCCYVCQRCAQKLCQKSSEGQAKGENGGLKCPQCRVKVTKRQFIKHEFSHINVEKATAMLIASGLNFSPSSNGGVNSDYGEEKVPVKVVKSKAPKIMKPPITTTSNYKPSVKYVDVLTKKHVYDVLTSTPNVAGVRPALTTAITPVLPASDGVKSNHNRSHEDESSSDEAEDVFKKPMLAKIHEKLTNTGSGDDQDQNKPAAKTADGGQRTYSKMSPIKRTTHFDRVMGTSTVALQSVPETCNKAQQTDEENGDMYSRLSKLFSCLCGDHGVEGVITVEGIGKFEIKLSKVNTVAPAEQKTNNGVESACQTPVCMSVENSCQTEPHLLSKVSFDKCIGTVKVHCRASEAQTESDRFVDVGAEVASVGCLNISQVSSSTIPEASDPSEISRGPEKEAENDSVKDSPEKSIGGRPESEQLLNSLDSDVLLLGTQEEESLRNYDFSTVIGSSQENRISVTETLEHAVNETVSHIETTVSETQLSDQLLNTKPIEEPVHLPERKRIKCFVDSSDDEGEQKKSKVPGVPKEKKKKEDTKEESSYMVETDEDDDSLLNAALDSMEMNNDCVPPTPPKRAKNESPKQSPIRDVGKEKNNVKPAKDVKNGGPKKSRLRL